MSGLLFVSQAILESWTEGGKVDFQGNVVTVLSGEGQGRSYALDPAVRFMKVLGAERDPNALLGKVKSEAQLRSLGAEQMGDSVVLGEIAYEVQPGFLAEFAQLPVASAANAQLAVTGGGAGAPPAPMVSKMPPAGEAPAAPPAQLADQGVNAAAHLPRDLEEKREEAEALARFLLENLS